MLERSPDALSSAGCLDALRVLRALRRRRLDLVEAASERATTDTSPSVPSANAYGKALERYDEANHLQEVDDGALSERSLLENVTRDVSSALKSSQPRHGNAIQRR
ncbi:MAG: hypothetical protein BGO98_23840 [Myxococcales bacterium 68-20]|nr:MAG: hypothetical protein BGO98_23840 [Myxococcales bacterium 68-20]